MAIDYAKFIDRMQPQPIPVSYPRLDRDTATDLGDYLWAVARAYADVHGETKMQRVVSSSFHTMINGWNTGQSTQACAEDLA